MSGLLFMTTQRRGAIGVLPGENGTLLVIERSATVRAPGKYCFPGGEIEEGETEQAAVQRELREEVGLEVEPLRQLWKSEAQSGVLLHWWLVRRVDAAQPPQPNPREVASCHWLSLEEIEHHPKTLLTNRRFAAAVRDGGIDSADFWAK